MNKYEELVKQQRGILNLPLWIFSGKRLVQRLKLDYEDREKLRREVKETKIKLAKDLREFEARLRKESAEIVKDLNKKIADLEIKIENLSKEVKKNEKRI